MLCKKKLVKTDLQHEEKRFYGRRQGRPLNASRREVMDALLPKLSISGDILSEQGNLDPAALFDSAAQGYWFEIGFGAGEHLSGLMRQNPDTAYIGAEPYINGMSAFLKDISDNPPRPLTSSRGLTTGSHHDLTKDTAVIPSGAQESQDDIRYNVRVHMDDAMMVAHSLADQSLNGIYILNPDPWHKTRHHKRRIVSPENLGCFARILKPGGDLILSTDVPYLAEWMVTHTVRHGAFEWSARSSQDWWNAPEDWIHTAYETKKAKGHARQGYFLFKRTHRQAVS